MKKIIAVIIILAVLVAAGVWWFYGQEDTDVAGGGDGSGAQIQEEAEDTGAANGSNAKQVQIAPEVPSAPPSFADGSLYLKAIGARDIEMCKKIQDITLKKKCETKIEEL